MKTTVLFLLASISASLQAATTSRIFTYIPVPWGFFASITTNSTGTEPYLINRDGDLISLGDLNPGTASSAPDGYRLGNIVLFHVTRHNLAASSGIRTELPTAHIF